jgi:hypothetical protein
MKEQHGEEDAAASTDASQKILFPSVECSAQDQETPDTPGPQGDEPNVKTRLPKNTWKRKVRRYVLKLSKEGPDRHIELLLALVISFFAYMQWHTAKSNNESATQQTDQLIAAAKISALAAKENAATAQSFADSAARINTGIGNAVDKLNAQVATTSDLAVAAGKQADQALVQSHAAQQQSVISANQLELSQRPWVSANFSVASPLVFDQDGGHVSIFVVIKNTGHSPAVRGFYDFKLYPTFLRLPDPVEERETICKNVEGQSALQNNVKFSQTFFVDDNIGSNIGLTMSPEQIKNAMVDIPESLFPNSHPNNKNWVEWAPIVLVSCIAYRPFFADKQYHTGYIFSLDRVDPKSGNILMLKPTVGTSIPANELRLSYLFGTGTDAD